MLKDIGRRTKNQTGKGGNTLCSRNSVVSLVFMVDVVHTLNSRACSHQRGRFYNELKASLGGARRFFCCARLT